MLTLIPAYGRDYKSVKAVKEDYVAGKDFIIADYSHPYDGKPTNINQDNGTVRIRFNQNRKFTVIN